MNQDHIPTGFDGVFRFTNPTSEEFVTMWNSVEYKFPPMSTSPLIIMGESPENVQAIRKKFAHRLAVEVFYNSDRYNDLNDLTKKKGVPPLVDFEKEPVFIEFVQKCLEDLPVSHAAVEPIKKEVPIVSEHTKIIKEQDSLKANATDADGELNNLPGTE
jgi:hypothetical protein